MEREYSLSRQMGNDHLTQVFFAFLLVLGLIAVFGVVAAATGLVPEVSVINAALGGIIWILVPSALLFSRIKRGRYLVEKGIALDAVVTKIFVAKGRRKKRVWIEFTYDLDGETRTATGEVNRLPDGKLSEKYGSGNKIKILADPNDKSKVVLMDHFVEPKE